MPSSITFIATSTSSHKRQRSSPPSTLIVSNTYTITDSRRQLCRGARVSPVQPPFAPSIFDFPPSFVSRPPASGAIVMPSVVRLPTLPSVPFGQWVWPCRAVDWPGSVVLPPAFLVARPFLLFVLVIRLSRFTLLALVLSRPLRLPSVRLAQSASRLIISQSGAKLRPNLYSRPFSYSKCRRAVLKMFCLHVANSSP